MRLEYSAAADADLDEILTYNTLQFGEAIADEYFFSFENAFARLVRHPGTGLPVEQSEPARAS